MTTNRHFHCAAWITALLVVGCATVRTRQEAAAERADVLRAAVAEVIADPARRGELTRSIDGMEAAMLGAFADGERLNRVFVDASTEPSATVEELHVIAGRIAAARRARLRQLMAARIALRRGMTGPEWSALASRWPEFDGGVQ